MASVLEEIGEPDAEERQMEEEQKAVQPPTEEELAAQEEEVAEEAKEEKPVEEKEPEKTVPYGALHQERMRRQQLEQQMQAMEQRFTTLMEKVTPEEKAPEYEEDPGGHLKYRLDKTESAAAETAKQMEERRQAELQAQQAQLWANSFTAREKEFAARQSDYYDAAQYLKESRLQEYVAMGWDPGMAQDAILKEAYALGMDADERGIDPAQRFYELAKVRGWKKEAKTSPVEQVERLKKNVERAGTSLDSSAQTKKRPTLADLADLDDDEFDKATEGDLWRRLWAN